LFPELSLKDLDKFFPLGFDVLLLFLLLQRGHDEAEVKEAFLPYPLIG